MNNSLTVLRFWLYATLLVLSTLIIALLAALIYASPWFVASASSNHQTSPEDYSEKPLSKYILKTYQALSYPSFHRNPSLGRSPVLNNLERVHST